MKRVVFIMMVSVFSLSSCAVYTTGSTTKVVYHEQPVYVANTPQPKPEPPKPKYYKEPKRKVEKKQPVKQQPQTKVVVVQSSGRATGSGGVNTSRTTAPSSSTRIGSTATAVTNKVEKNEIVRTQSVSTSSDRQSTTRTTSTSSTSRSTSTRSSDNSRTAQR